MPSLCRKEKKMPKAEDLLETMEWPSPSTIELDNCTFTFKGLAVPG